MQKEMPLPQQRAKEQMPPKERNFVERLATSVDDFIGDVVAANAMAKEKFDGDSALMHAARGGVTGLIGVGLGEVFDKTLQKGMKDGSMWFSKVMLPVNSELTKKYEKLGVRTKYFVESATKNLMVGVTYNGLAYFSRPMLPSVESKHLLASVATSAVDAVGQKGAEKAIEINPSDEQKDSDKLALVFARQLREKREALRQMPRGGDVAQSERERLMDDLNHQQSAWDLDIEHATVENGKLKKRHKKTIPVKDVYPKPFSPEELEIKIRAIETVATDRGFQAEERLKNAAHELTNLMKEYKQKDPNILKIYRHLLSEDASRKRTTHGLELGTADRNNRTFFSNLELQAKDQMKRFVDHANPVTIMGLDWVVDGVATLVANTKKVRDLRKEYGGLEGKKVPIAPPDARRRYTDRKPYDQKPFSNKDQVYYGKARWTGPKQEVDLEKFD